MPAVFRSLATEKKSLNAASACNRSTIALDMHTMPPLM